MKVCIKNIGDGRFTTETLPQKDFVSLFARLHKAVGLQSWGNEDVVVDADHSIASGRVETGLLFTESNPMLLNQYLIRFKEREEDEDGAE